MTQKTSYIGPKIALYQPDSPQNTAAIIRTCSCLGVELEIIEPCGFFLTDPRFKRVVMDYLDISLINFIPLAFSHHIDSVLTANTKPLEAFPDAFITVSSIPHTLAIN